MPRGRGQRRLPGSPNRRLSREQALDQSLSSQPEVLSDVAQDAGESPNAEASMPRNCDVVVAGPRRGHPKMATGPDGSPGSPRWPGPSRDRRRRRPAAASSADDFLADEVEADNLGSLALLEMAGGCVAAPLVQACEAVGLREDRLPERPGREAALRGLLHQEDQLRQVAACHRLTNIASPGGLPAIETGASIRIPACEAALAKPRWA